MIKSIAFMPRRPGTSRADFCDHYEERHVPLALNWFRFSKYVRNHLQGEVEPGFDCLSEFWRVNPAEIGPLMAGPVGETMAEDERRFVDKPNIQAALAETADLGGGARPYEAKATPKRLLLLQGSDRNTLVAAATDLARARAERTALDLLIPYDDRPLRCDAILSLWGTGDDAFAPPAGWTIVARLEAVAEETPPETLAKTPQPAV